MDPSVVFVLDDDPAIRQSLSSLFRSVGHAVMLFDTPAAFLAQDRPDLPGCLVLDVRLPDLSGLELQTRYAGNGNLPPVVFISGHGDIPMSVAAMKGGAIEFLTKPFRDQDILDAVHRGIALDREGRRQALSDGALWDRHQSLTQREREVMTLVAEGRVNKQIAADLGVSEVTVKAHRAQAMRKMGAATLPDLVRLSDRLGRLTERAKSPPPPA